MVCILILSVLFWQPPADAVVSGWVDVVDGRPSAAPRTSARYARGRSDATTARDAVPVLVWLEGSEPVSRSAAAAPVLNQKDTKFEPRLVVVVAGQVVRVLNSDPIYHNVFSLSDVKRFNVGRRPAGEYVDIRFDKPGEVAVFCDIHSSMTATIRVLPPTAVQWVVMESGAEFRLAGIPPGRYTLHVSSPGYSETRRMVDLSAGQRLELPPITMN